MNRTRSISTRVYPFSSRILRIAYLYITILTDRDGPPIGTCLVLILQVPFCHKILDRDLPRISVHFIRFYLSFHHIPSSGQTQVVNQYMNSNLFGISIPVSLKYSSEYSPVSSSNVIFVIRVGTDRFIVTRLPSDTDIRSTICRISS